MNQELIKSVVKEVVLNHVQGISGNIPIAISNRHIHLSLEDLERLFGKGYQLKKQKDLSQPNQFAAQEMVTLIGPKGRIPKVRILGPAREQTQVEISRFDGFVIGVKPPIRNSGDLKGSAPITVQGPRGQVTLKEGLICAARHIHMHTKDGEIFGVKDGEQVQVKVEGARGITFSNVLVRVSPKYRLEMHVDLDEANAAELTNGQLGKLIKEAAAAKSKMKTGGCSCGCKRKN